MAIPLNSFDLSSQSGKYIPPPYSVVNFSFGREIEKKVDIYYPPDYSSVNFDISGNYYTTDANIVNFSLAYVQPSLDCEPDWYPHAGNDLLFDFHTCDDSIEIPGGNPTNLIFAFDCCKTCDPDFIQQSGDSIIVDIDSCDGNPDFINQNGNSILVNFRCCDGVINNPVANASGSIKLGISLSGSAQYVSAISATGNIPLDISLNGVAQVVTIATASGAITLNAVLSGSAEVVSYTFVSGSFTLGMGLNGSAVHGENATGSIVIPSLSMTGEALYRPEFFLVEGSPTLNITATGSASYLTPVNAIGSPSLGISLTGVANLTPSAQGIDQSLNVVMQGSASITIPTATGSTSIEPLVMVGVATWKEVPTANSAITLNVNMSGDALYVALPTAWGSPTLSVVMESQPVKTGPIVYWSNISLSMNVSGAATFPLGMEGLNNGLGELTMQSNGIVVVQGSTSSVQIGELKMNRGWVEYGPKQPPTIREIYEASNVRTNAIRSYPIEAKYPIYIPTTDYNIKDVKLRRGTLDYTLEFDFDGIQVEQIKVWIVDENGNASLDSIAKWLGGPLENHVLNSPFRYSLAIPVHCVTSKKYEFILEVVYQNTNYNGTVLIERKSKYVPFQAHFDNRIPYSNMTDRTQIIDGYFDSISDTMLETTSVSFDPNTQAFEDTSDNVYLSNGAVEQAEFINSYFELTVIKLELYEITKATGFGCSVAPDYESQYYELDVGQIGG